MGGGAVTITTLATIMFSAMSAYSQTQPNALPTNGNIGIGTATPACELDVKGATSIDGTLVVKDSVRLEKKLIVDQDTRIKGKTVIDGNLRAKSNLKVVGNARVDGNSRTIGNNVVDGNLKAKSNLRVLGNTITEGNNRIDGNAKIFGVTKMKGNAFVEGDFKFKQLADPTATADKWLTIDENGKVKSLDKAGMASSILADAYGTSCKFGTNTPISAYWKSIPNLNYGILATGFECGSRVGIGTDYPLAKLDVRGTTQSYEVNLTETDGSSYLRSVKSGNKRCLIIEQDYTSLNFSDADSLGQHPFGVWGIEYNPGAEGLNFWKPFPNETGHKNYVMFLNNNGNVGINTRYTPYTLSVDGSIGARLVKVEMDTWSDHVFEDDYQFLTIEELEVFINENNHLPNVPSESEVLENGIDLGQTDAILLEKIEELALYIIQLKKDNDALNEKFEKLFNQN